MNTVTHSVAPEEIMAYLDGELSVAEAQAVCAHLEQCLECARVADGLRATSDSIARWTVPAVDLRVEEQVLSAAAWTTPDTAAARPGRSNDLSIWNWRLWAIGGGGAFAALLMLTIFDATVRHREDKQQFAQSVMAKLQSANPALSATRAKGDQRSTQIDDLNAGSVGALQSSAVEGRPKASPNTEKTDYGYYDAPAQQSQVSAVNALAPEPPPPPPAPARAPMIARTVSLTIVVKDFAVSRASLDSILVRHHGYAAHLTAATAENTPRSIQASLRIPAPEIATALGELKSLGLVQNETQSGEEVTQQHTDLVARLKNSRETEGRLRAILEQRTGKIEDVLQVEEEIARVRGEIESMQAEQQELEHRVEFASVDLELTEEFKAQLNPPSTSVSNRIHNAFVEGMHNVGDSVLSVVLSLEEDGPVLLIWIAILGVPAFLLVRRYRRVKAKF